MMKTAKFLSRLNALLFCSLIVGAIGVRYVQNARLEAARDAYFRELARSLPPTDLETAIETVEAYGYDVVDGDYDRGEREVFRF